MIPFMKFKNFIFVDTQHSVTFRTTVTYVMVLCVYLYKKVM